MFCYDFLLERDYVHALCRSPWFLIWISFQQQQNTWAFHNHTSIMKSESVNSYNAFNQFSMQEGRMSPNRSSTNWYSHILSFYWICKSPGLRSGCFEHFVPLKKKRQVQLASAHLGQAKSLFWTYPLVMKVSSSGWVEIIFGNNTIPTVRNTFYCFIRKHWTVLKVNIIFNSKITITSSRLQWFYSMCTGQSYFRYFSTFLLQHLVIGCFG